MSKYIIEVLNGYFDLVGFVKEANEKNYEITSVVQESGNYAIIYRKPKNKEAKNDSK